MRIIRSEDRGRSQYGWLDSRHTFSFANYYNPEYKGVSELRVINDDIVVPGKGFDTHSHRDVEIISYILEGVKCCNCQVGNCMDKEEGGLLVLKMIRPKSVDFVRSVWFFVGRNKKLALPIPTRRDCDGSILFQYFRIPRYLVVS